MTRDSDPVTKEKAKSFLDAHDVLTEKQARAIEDGVPTAHVVRLRGSHFVFLSSEDEVLREMRVFIDGLK